LAARVALVAVGHEDEPAAVLRGLRRHELAGQGLAAARAAAAGRHGQGAQRQQRAGRYSSRVIFHRTPVPFTGSAPSALAVTMPKSTTKRERPSGEKRAATGRSKPPELSIDAGPLTLPLLTAKSSMTPLCGSTRTTLKPTGPATRPLSGDKSPNSATK